MPTLNWIGKDAVATHDKDVPFRLLEPVLALSCPPLPPAGDRTRLPPREGGEGGNAADTGNLIVQGDNLLALKVLLGRYPKLQLCALSGLFPSEPERTARNFRIVRSASQETPATSLQW